MGRPVHGCGGAEARNLQAQRRRWQRLHQCLEHREPKTFLSLVSMFQFVLIFVFNKRWFVACLLVCCKSPSWRLRISPHKGLGGYMCGRPARLISLRHASHHPEAIRLLRDLEGPTAVCRVKPDETTKPQTSHTIIRSKANSRYTTRHH
jgi:hypothetical protein